MEVFEISASTVPYVLSFPVRADVKLNVDANQERFGNTQVTASCIVWDGVAEFKEYKKKFDFVLCADCLYFRDCHMALLHTMASILKDEGEIIIFAPHRSGTLSQFIGKAKEAFHVQITEQYDGTLWDYHQQALRNLPSVYKPDIHYPVMLCLKKLFPSGQK